MTKSRLAVLPLINLAHHDYNSKVDGLSELATDIFIRSNKYIIISSESTSQFKNEQLEAIYKDLNVAFVFGGIFSIDNTMVKLSLQIQEENKVKPIWQDVIEIELVKLIQLGNRLQSSIEQYERIEDTDLSTVVRLPQNLEIRTAFELGNHYLNKHDPAYAELALNQFQKVIDREPDFLPSYVGYAETAIFLVGRGYRKASILYPKVLNMLDTMIRFNPNYGELYICRGIIDFFYTLDWKSTYRNIEKGLTSFSEASKSYLQLSFFWYGMKNFDKALECVDIALEYNPLSVSLLNMKSDIYLSARNYKSARESYLSILKINPDDAVAYEYLMFIALMENNRKQAKYYKNKLSKITNEDFINHPRLLYYYGKMQLHDQWKVAKEKIESLDIDTMRLGRLAMLYSGVKDKDKLMFFSEKAFNARTGILFILTDPIFDNIRSWSRYQTLENQIILPEGLSDDDTITIQSELKASLVVAPKTILYAKAEEKYVEIFYYKHFRIQSTLLRMRIEKLMNQLPSNIFWKSHRSYIINKSLRFEMAGNSRGYLLYNKKYGFEVPVSRSKIDEMKKLLS